MNFGKFPSLGENKDFLLECRPTLRLCCYHDYYQVPLLHMALCGRVDLHLQHPPPGHHQHGQIHRRHPPSHLSQHHDGQKVSIYLFIIKYHVMLTDVKGERKYKLQR